MKKFTTEIAILVAGGLMLLATVIAEQVQSRKSAKEAVVALPQPELRFGIPVDSFRIREGIIRPEQNLGEILAGFGISMTKVDQLVKASAGIFDLKKIRSGQNYFLFQEHDTANTTRYLVYENNAVEYVVFDLKDSTSISLGKKEVRKVYKTASGVIHSNLWNTMTENNLNPVLALELSDVYAWSIDFFGIQRGDRFRVLYEEQFVDSVSIGIGPVHAAEFEHMGKSFYAFRYFQDKSFDYFDDRGDNIRRAFLKAPLSFSRISSRFSGSRMHPILKIRRPHFGVDYTAPKGTPVVSIGDGVVIEKGYHGGAGNAVKIKHNGVYTTQYMHLSGYGQGIFPGAHVTQGQVIGFVGSTGLSTGPHLDFRVYKNGSPVDPLKMEAPPSEPVKKEFRSDYLYVKDSLMRRIYTIRWNK
ncbi:MAG TPA: peptidoglycan DD-metalloendopeptidase family protein [Prolixibacteraceae bacterium]|nr:peptidoglycan DD-metalloendopeptidase family protein [Prolixibacteraceae bacterium]